MRAKRTWRWPSAAIIVLTGAAAPMASSVAALDPARSRIIVEVGKAGAFSFVAGHSHRVAAPIHGTLSIDPGHPEGAVASFEIRTRDLTVLEQGEPPGDVPQVQQTMASERVLDVQRYPTVTFQSRGIEVRQRNENALDLTVTGDLTLHGTTRPIAVPIHAEIATNVVTARGSFSVKQTDYGMKPVKVAGGAVAVKDELKIELTFVAPIGSSSARAPGSAPASHGLLNNDKESRAKLTLT